MKFSNLFEVSAEDFKWYENPTKEQMDEITGEDGKIHFIAFPEGKVIVFPKDVSFGDFVKGRGGHIALHKNDSMFGTAQKSGMGYMAVSIANKSHLKNTGWDWLNKYIDVKPLFKHSGKKSTSFETSKEKPDEEEIKKNITLSLDKQGEKKTNFKKVSLKDFLEKHKAGEN